MISRRDFLQKSIGLVGASAFSSCSTTQSINGKIVGQNFALGHKLRTMDFPPVTQSVKEDVVIIGGGVSGLSAARYLKQQNVTFRLLELGSEVGGNSVGGENSTSAYPWGAHYLPLPNLNNPELILFLKEVDVIKGFENDLPVYNEYYLCFDPKDRLFINHYWQEGIIPHEGVPLKDRQEIERFLNLMHGFKDKKGTDGKDAFCIPVEQSSADNEFIALDGITMQQYIEKNGFSSPYLKWYLNYCCADDYGSTIEDTSAWAAIHYFASRKGKAANATSDAVLTWPEGNYWLIKKLRQPIDAFIERNALVYKITEQNNNIQIYYYDANRNISISVIAQKVILATPQFITQRLLVSERNIDYKVFDYAPWMIANITTNSNLNERYGEPLSWDNVIYGSSSLGYVNAAHQSLSHHLPTQKVITFYQPLTGSNTALIRKDAFTKTFEEWGNFVINDLKKPHPNIVKNISNVDIWIWGHGMIKPQPNFIWSENIKRAKDPIKQKIYFAHSDLSGISIFEEAFYRGCKAAQQLIQTV